MELSHIKIIPMLIWGGIIILSTIFLVKSIIKDICKKNIRKFFFETLGFFNFLTVFCIAPLYLYKERIKNYFFFSKRFYTSLNGLEDFFNTISIILFSLLCYEIRYFLYKTAQHEKRFSKKNAIWILVIIISYAALVSIVKKILLLTYIKENGPDRLNENNSTTASNENDSWISEPVLFLSHSIVSFLPSVIVMFFNYFKIRRYFIKNSKKKKDISLNALPSEAVDRGTERNGAEQSSARGGIESPFYDTLNEKSQKGLKKKYIRFLGIKIILISLSKLLLIIYNIVILGDNSLKSEYIELILKLVGWGCTAFMLLDCLKHNYYFNKAWKFCCCCFYICDKLELIAVN